MAAADDAEELPKIAGDPHNAVQMRPVRTIYGQDIPEGGFVVKMAKSCKLSELKAALAERLSISEDSFTFAYEGEEMDEQKTIQENGIPEPGPAARRAGARVELLFLIKDGVEIGAQRARREAAEAAAEAEKHRQEEESRRRQEEEARRLQAEEEQKMAAKRKADAEAEQRRQDEARRQHRCVLRCLEIGGGGGKELITASNLTVQEVARQLCRELNMLRDDEHRGGIVLLHNGQPLPGRQTLQDSGVNDGDEVMYFWGEGGEAAGAADIP
ncbi:unnamed protein product [Durusdinium trenchii]|uniref:Ubiquitin-like domain-containing protein n=2 Tax=Durusdinium trenchii TaxID=1381693 RepID=A0ABP0SW00_9DINO